MYFRQETTKHEVYGITAKRVLFMVQSTGSDITANVEVGQSLLNLSKQSSCTNLQFGGMLTESTVLK